MAAARGSHEIAVLALIFYLTGIPVSASVCISCSQRRMESASAPSTTAVCVGGILPAAVVRFFRARFDDLSTPDCEIVMAENHSEQQELTP
jgi:hypothetical protein